jgi:hypothetical protein
VASRLLVAGVIVSFTLLIAGLIGLVVRGGIPAKLDWRQLTDRTDGLSPSLLLHVGVLDLVATPVVNVTALGLEFVRKRETLFALLCFGILLLLLAGLVTGVK